MVKTQGWNSRGEEKKGMRPQESSKKNKENTGEDKSSTRKNTGKNKGVCR